MAKRYILIIIPVLIIGFVVYQFSDIVAYVLISWVLSLVGKPIMNFFNSVRIWKFGLGKSVSALLTLIIFVIIALALVMIMTPVFIEQANNLSAINFESILETIREPIERVSERLRSWGLLKAEDTQMEDTRQFLGRYFQPSAIGDFISGLINATSSIMIAIVSILFITFFFLRESDLFNNFILALVPDKYEDQTIHMIEDMTILLRNYFGGILLQMTIITILVSVSLSILGIKNALFIGFMAALLNVIPYIGPMLGAILAIFITIASNLEVDFYDVLMGKIIWVVIVFGCMQLIDNILLQPQIYSRSVRAHPLEIFLVILIAGKLGGVIGMILAIPSYTVIRVIAATFLHKFKLVKQLTSKMDIENL